MSLSGGLGAKLGRLVTTHLSLSGGLGAKLVLKNPKYIVLKCF